MIDSGLVGSTAGRGAARAEDAQGTPTQSRTLPCVLVYEGYPGAVRVAEGQVGVARQVVHLPHMIKFIKRAREYV